MSLGKQIETPQYNLDGNRIARNTHAWWHMKNNFARNTEWRVMPAAFFAVTHWSDTAHPRPLAHFDISEKQTHTLHPMA